GGSSAAPRPAALGESLGALVSGTPFQRSKERSEPHRKCLLFEEAVCVTMTRASLPVAQTERRGRSQAGVCERPPGHGCFATACGHRGGRSLGSPISENEN